MNKMTILFVDPTDGSWNTFQCYAEDMGHADEQTENAYPECHIIWSCDGFLDFEEAVEEYEKECDRLWGTK